MESFKTTNSAVVNKDNIDEQAITAPALRNSLRASYFITGSIEKLWVPGFEPETDLLSLQESLSILHVALLDVALAGVQTDQTLQRHPRLAQAVRNCERDLGELHRRIAALTSSERMAKRVCNWSKFKWMFMEGNSQNYEERFSFHADMINFHCHKITASTHGSVYGSSHETSTTAGAALAIERKLGTRKSNLRNTGLQRRRRELKRRSESGNWSSPTTTTSEVPTVVHKLCVSVGIDPNKTDKALDSIESRLEMPVKSPHPPVETQQRETDDEDISSKPGLGLQVATRTSERKIFKELVVKSGNRKEASGFILEYYNYYTERKLSGRMLKYLSNAIVGMEAVPTKKRRSFTA
ncbi:hypothetical protein ABW21_db0208922 [Orbilia brochopaga]|nr:hypothetical protein ABW21_db0208922 [Drechslerella brochopaga]